jgi:acyl-coenzyme A synthetase/AMP-(fatty) acid ligase
LTDIFVAQLIKVNALQVAPAELEDQLLKSDVITDAAVVGVTLHDEEWPLAYVVLTDEAKAKKTTPKQIQDWFKPRVAKHKALVGGVQFVDEIVSLDSCLSCLYAECLLTFVAAETAEW